MHAHRSRDRARVNRRCDMPERGYELYLQLSEANEREISSTREEKLESTSAHVVLCLSYGC